MKQKVTPFLSVLLALSFLLPAALFAKPIEAQAANINLVSQGVDFYYGSNLHSSYSSVPFTVKLNATYGGKLDGSFVLDFKRKISWTEGTDWTLSAKLDPAAFQNVKAYVSFNIGQNYWTRQCTYDNGILTCHEDSWENDSKDVHVELHIYGFTYKPAYKDKKIVLDFESIQVGSKSEEQGFWNKVVQWLKDIRDKLVNGFNDMVNAIELQFRQLVEKLQSLFDEVTEWLFNCVESIQDFMHNVGAWFTNLGNSISGFFEKLWNRIWWGNENGESEYVKPTISNKLLDILATLQDYQEKLKSTIDTIGAAASDVASYISAGTSFVNGVVGVAGAGFTALIVFGIVFVLVRKVVGR